MTTPAEILAAQGHTSDGMCEKCWREGATLYAAGQGAYESHFDAYSAAMDRANADAERLAAERNNADGAA